MTPAIPVFLFCGPTAYGLPAHLLSDPQLTRLPPAERGSVRAVVEHASSVGRIVLVDGRLGDVMAVGHREILSALDRGWQVWGLSSMGAIRAAELHYFGMRGVGAVFRHYRDTSAPDDEVAILHGPAPDYRPITEALVDIRMFLRHLAKIAILTDRHARIVELRLGREWFGDRTRRAIVEACGEVAGQQVAALVSDQVSELSSIGLKQQDLRSFLTSREWAR